MRKFGLNKKFLIFIFSLAAIVFIGVRLILSDLPNVGRMKSCMTTKMYKLWLCPAGDNYVTLDQISEYLKEAILISEDSSFFYHQGFDWRELRKSLLLNLKRLRFARGGSTITQQLAKNVFLTPEKTIVRKIKEAYLAAQIEDIFTKEEILERYLNVIQFGPETFGISKASQHYFSKSPENLDLVEGVFLAFLIPNPERYYKSFADKQLSPYAKKRVDQILEYLFKYHKITQSEYDNAKTNIENLLINEEAIPTIEQIAAETSMDTSLESAQSEPQTGTNSLPEPFSPIDVLAPPTEDLSPDPVLESQSDIEPHLEPQLGPEPPQEFGPTLLPDPAPEAPPEIKPTLESASTENEY